MPVMLLLLVLAGASASVCLTLVLPTLAAELLEQGSDNYELVYSMYNSANQAGNILGPAGGSALLKACGIEVAYGTAGGLAVAYSVVAAATVCMHKRQAVNRVPPKGPAVTAMW